MQTVCLHNACAMSENRAQVTIRNVDRKVLARLKQKAAANGRSLEGELRLLLEHHARPGSNVEEDALTYVRERTERVTGTPRKGQVFPKPKVIRFTRVERIKVKGKLVSGSLIEDRR